MIEITRSLLNGHGISRGTDQLEPSRSLGSQRNSTANVVLVGLGVLTALLSPSISPFAGHAFAQGKGNGAAAPATAPAVNSVTPAAPVVMGGSVDNTTYVLGPGDGINIEVYGDASLTKPQRIRPDGMINISIVGEIMAAGLTPKRLGEQVAQALSEKMNDPIVSIDVIDVQSKKYTISGAVNKVGPYAMPTPVTIFAALSSAGGFTQWANRKKIQVIHENGESVYFNYEDYLKGKNKDKNKNFLLENNDTIVVKD
jgi:polysaccharide export outer membrane protein